MNTVEASLVVAALFIAIFFIMRAKDKSNERAAENAKGLISLVGERAVFVYERCSAMTQYLSIERYRQTSYKYNPATATYTGVSVGGVHTGGWTVDEAHYSLEGGSYTDKFNLFYRERKLVGGKWTSVWHAVDTVYLSKEDAALAKNAGLGRWLHDNKLTLSNPVSSQDLVLREKIYEQYGENHDFYSTSNLLSMQAEKYMLNHDEILRIFSFLCGEMVKVPDPTQFVCTACGKRFSGWYKECPKCHALGKMQKAPKDEPEEAPVEVVQSRDTKKRQAPEKSGQGKKTKTGENEKKLFADKKLAAIWGELMGIADRVDRLAYLSDALDDGRISFEEYNELASAL